MSELEGRDPMGTPKTRERGEVRGARTELGGGGLGIPNYFFGGESRMRGQI